MQNITRYMSLEKCMDFISNQQLFFARLDSFDDKLEGYSLTQLVEEAGIVIEGLSEERRNKLRPVERKTILFASCWYKGAENLAIWDRVRFDHGLAISINKESFTNAFNLSSIDIDYTINHQEHSVLRSPQLRDKYSGDIKYISNNLKKKEQSYRLGLIKLSAFVHEKEFRFVVRLNGNKNHIRASNVKWKVNNFNKLEFSIITNPYMKKNMTEMLASYVSSKGFDNIKIMESKFYSLFN